MAKPEGMSKLMDRPLTRPLAQQARAARHPVRFFLQARH
jgi:hypothetical protein